MLRVDLKELQRAKKVALRGTISGTDPLWGEIDFAFGGDVEADLSVEWTAADQIVAQGQIRAEIVQPCRRCLAEVRETMDFPVFLVWDASDGGGVDPDEGDDELRTVDPGATDLEVDAAVREEVLLAVTPYPLCREDCRGLCPVCGADRNVEECGCEIENSDPRWDNLRGLSDDSGLR